MAMALENQVGIFAFRKGLKPLVDRLLVAWPSNQLNNNTSGTKIS
jgi:hypothetical protein